MGISEILKWFIPIVPFYNHKLSKMGIQVKCVSFYFYGSFYGYKFSKMGIQGNGGSFLLQT